MEAVQVVEFHYHGEYFGGFLLQHTHTPTMGDQPASSNPRVLE
jgi:hypothetical protein